MYSIGTCIYKQAAVSRISISMISIFLLFVFSSSLVAFFFFLTGKFKNKKSLNLPPGSLGWPIIGETLDYFQMSQKGMVGTFMSSRMEKYDNRVFKTSLFGYPMVFFFGPAGNKLLFSNENKLVTLWWTTPIRKLFNSGFINKVGDDAKRLRRMFMGFLDVEALQRYMETIDRVTQHHFETNWEGQEEVKVYPLVKKYTFELACRLFLSLDEPQHIMKLLDKCHIINKGIMSIPLNFPGTRFYRALKEADALRGEFQEMINHRRMALEETTAPPTQDLLSHLLVHPDEAGRFMTETEIKNNILDLLFAAFDSTASVLTRVIKSLGELPEEVYDKVLKEQMEIVESKGAREFLEWGDIQKMRYSWNVISEIMRLLPAASGTFRQAIVDFNYAGYTIPKGWKIGWSMHGTHDDPNIFPNPTKFDPSRFEEGTKPFTFVPFGGGPRMCLGKEYARLEMLVFLHHVVKRFKWKLLIPDEKFENDPMPTPTKGLPIRLQPHQF